MSEYVDNNTANANNSDQDHIDENQSHPIISTPPKLVYSPGPNGGSAMKWNQHPVIATVLWILGSSSEHQHPSSLGRSQSESENGSSSGKLNVLWKDEHGGNIVEFVSQVQRSAGELMDGTAGGTQLYPRSVEDQRRLGGENSHDDTEPSPQWGFYIPITPPQQEMFSVIKRDILAKQTNHRVASVAGGPTTGSSGSSNRS